MTICMSIANNLEHCRQHNLVETKREPCLCVEDVKPDPKCRWCGGTQYHAISAMIQFKLGDTKEANAQIELALELLGSGTQDSPIVREASALIGMKLPENGDEERRVDGKTLCCSR